MAQKEQIRPVRGLIRNLARWAPFLALPFSVLFAETWLQLHIFQNDYLTNHLTQQNRQLRNEINDMRARQADLEGMRRLEDFAPQIGLIEPEHGQIRMLPAPAEPHPQPANEQPITYAKTNLLGTQQSEESE